jgi:hypothetical protein
VSEPVVTPEIAQSAFDWLSTDSNDIALARANLVRAEFEAKKAYARAFKCAVGAVESRKMDAMLDDGYGTAMERLAIAEGEWERQKDQRNRAQTILECWRTQQASERYLTQRFK